MSLKTWLKYKFSMPERIPSFAWVDYSLMTESGHEIEEIQEGIEVDKTRFLELDKYYNYEFEESLTKENKEKFNKRAAEILKVAQKKGLKTTKEKSVYFKGKHITECMWEITAYTRLVKYDEWLKIKGLKK